VKLENQILIAAAGVPTAHFPGEKQGFHPSSATADAEIILLVLVTVGAFFSFLKRRR
jgi:hypothetical protein